MLHIRIMDLWLPCYGGYLPDNLRLRRCSPHVPLHVYPHTLHDALILQFTLDTFSHHLLSPCVVFDDGDERTLKRSSLCLKGARHFDKSETLDNLPLTDPENFGTPVLHSAKKPSRKRRRGSQSPSRKEEEGLNGKRHCSYPEKFPVGKVSKGRELEGTGERGGEWGKRGEGERGRGSGKD